MATGEIPMTELVREAIDGARELARIEVALAKDEMTREVAQLKKSAILIGVAALLTAFGLVLLLVSLALFIGNAVISLVVGLGLAFVGISMGAAAWAKLPKTPMEQTTRRLQSDVSNLKERIA